MKTKFLILINIIIFFKVYGNEKNNLIKPKLTSYFNLLKAKQEKEKEKEKKYEIEKENKIYTKEKIKEEPKNNILHKNRSENFFKIFDDPILNENKISLFSKNSEVKDIVELLKRGSKIDFLIDADVKGCTGILSFKNHTVGQILNYILTHNDPQLTLIRDFNNWRIMLRTKAEEYIRTIEHANLVTKIFNVNNACVNEKFKETVEKAWNNIVPEDRKNFSCIFIDIERKKVFIKGYVKDVDDFTSFFSEIDKHVTQVRIDAIIVFAEKDYNFSFGINWSGIYNRQNSIQAKRKAFDFVGLGGTLDDFPEPTQPFNPRFGNLLVDPTNFAINLFTKTFLTPREAKPHQISDTYISIPFVFGGPSLNLRRLNLLLNAAENEEKVKIISRPSLMTSDNEIAKILIGETIPIQATAIDILAVAVQNITSINYKDIGISFEVRPVVSPDKKNINLEILIEESKVIAGSTIANDKGIMQNPPVIDVIKIHNKVNLRNGQTVVIGGLSRCDERRGNNKVPIFHKLPLIGKWLFTSTAENKEEFEQFIFITPTIVD